MNGILAGGKPNMYMYVYIYMYKYIYIYIKVEFQLKIIGLKLGETWVFNKKPYMLIKETIWSSQVQGCFGKNHPVVPTKHQVKTPSKPNIEK